MVTRHSFLRTALASGLAVAVLAGCGMMRTSSKMDIYEATLSGAQEVPPRPGAGTGMAEVQHNKETNTLSWKVTYSGLSGPLTGAHIHGPAPMGQNAGVVVPFSGNLNAQPIMGEARLTPEQAAALGNGLMYVNLHTAAAPGGEVRGQLRARR